MEYKVLQVVEPNSAESWAIVLKQKKFESNLGLPIENIGEGSVGSIIVEGSCRSLVTIL